MPQPWIFIHGAGSTAHTWSRQHRLPWPTMFLNLPAKPQILPDHLIAALADWIVPQIHEPAVLVGHSMGGAIAQTLALLVPDKVAALVLVGTGPRLPVNPELLNKLAVDPDAATANIARWSLARQFDPALYEANLRLLRQISPDRILHEMTACSLFDVRSRLHTYHGPAFLIRGAEDRMTPESLSQEFLSIWPQLPVYTIPKAGHLMMLESPDTFNAIMRSIYETLPL
ncbi:alpha/beta fold hydrolase [Sulfobacillus sp. hq2]|uniref:alpha/beta fold hydrolase n=1 Tax=Sulfobacillus sp. hq2 TaxID=2039167 RepID=UPI0013048133|nr:alpha/beta hydrolase [Sulfobacillus sp. hq2]